MCPRLKYVLLIYLCCVAYCKLEDEGVAEFAHALSQNKSMVELSLRIHPCERYLGSNNFVPNWVKTVAASLLKNCVLAKLILGTFVFLPLDSVQHY